MKHSTEVLNSRYELAKEKFNKFEDRSRLANLGNRNKE